MERRWRKRSEKEKEEGEYEERDKGYVKRVKRRNDA